MGPIVAILLRSDSNAPTPAELLELARTLDERARTSIEVSVRDTRSIGGAVHLRDGRPFGFTVGDAGLDEEERNAIRQGFGFSPVSALHVFACVNSAVDHLILGELGVFFAKRYGGIVDFGGNLGDVGAHAGKLIEIPYEANGSVATFHVADAGFLEEWLTNAAFHLIK
jgi:hypothetical protein